MLQDVVSVELPVGERFIIRKNVIEGGAGPGPDGGRRVCVVTGTHGDELEGQYVCFELARILEAGRGNLAGRVEIYPALNPLGVDSIIRGFPGFDLDMNRIFPGSLQGHLVENAAARLIADLRGADIVLDIHASNIFLREVMQARINVETAPALVPYAKRLGVDFIWVHDAATVLQATLAHSLNAIGTKTIVVEMGIGMRITRAYGDKLTAGILNLLAGMGMWRGETESDFPPPLLSTEGEVVFINAERSGLVIPAAAHSSAVTQGQSLCSIVDPFEGKTLCEVRSPVDGFLFTMREYPVVYEGSLIARIFCPFRAKEAA